MPPEESEKGKTFVLRPDLVARSFKALRSVRVHPQFAGYLCLKQASLQEKGSIDLKPNFKQFFEEYLRVPDGTEKKPYAFPFTDSVGSEANRWFNANVAGSYAPSSLRSKSPIQRLVNIKGQRTEATFSLKKDHHQIAADVLLYKTKVDAFALASFLFRDYGFIGANPVPGDVVEAFRSKFGYRQAMPQERDEFEALFMDGSSKYSADDVFEELGEE